MAELGRLASYASSCSFNFAITLKSSSVVVSPFTSPFVASSRSRRRMILPLLVFVTVRIIAHALDDHGGEVVPNASALHLKRNDFLAGCDLIAM